MDENQVSRVSAFWYTGISLAVAALFFVLTLGGEYTGVARIGGAVWVFILTMIVAMPVVIPYVKKRYQ